MISFNICLELMRKTRYLADFVSLKKCWALEHGLAFVVARRGYCDLVMDLVVRWY